MLHYCLPKLSLLKKSTRQQYSYNVTLRRVRESFLPLKTISIYWSVCAYVCACGYPGAWVCAWTYVRVALLIRRATPVRHIVSTQIWTHRNHHDPFAYSIEREAHEHFGKLLYTTRVSSRQNRQRTDAQRNKSIIRSHLSHTTT